METDGERGGEVSRLRSTRKLGAQQGLQLGPHIRYAIIQLLLASPYCLLLTAQVKEDN